MGSFGKRFRAVSAGKKFMEKYDKILDDYCRTYFSTSYNTVEESSTAFMLLNEKWKAVCKSAKSEKRGINLKEQSFANRVETVLNSIKEHKSKNQ